ncbi:MAG: hypothetical protein NVS3B2_17390 [Ramlibacter sp.]
MSNRVQGKNILVTAAGKGSGRASALALAREGGTVWATDVDEAALAELAALAREEGLAALRTAPLNVRDSAALQAFAQKTGRLDVLFNCAGFVHSGNILACEEADWDFSMDLNVKSMYRTLRAFLPAMLERGGSIINMASAASSVKGVPNRFVYGASKAAVIGARRVRRAPAARPRGPAGGDRGAGGVPGVGRVGVHHRHHPHDRRRLVELSGER